MRYFFILFLFSLATSLVSQNIQQRIDEIVADPALAGASIGVDVVDLSTGKSIASYRRKTALIPASTQKLITTGCALDLLGPSAVFNTELVAYGEIVDGVLRGDIYLVGQGDPTLGSATMPDGVEPEVILARWVKAIQDAGIKSINGTIVGDDSYYGSAGVPADWPWSDIGNYYGAGSYGLNWHDNLYYLDLTQRSREGTTPPIQQTRPEVPDLVIHNELRSGPRGSGDNAYIYGAPFNYNNYLRGTIPVGTGRFTIEGSLPDPARQAAWQLKNALEAAGIEVALPAASVRQFPQRELGPKQLLDKVSSPAIEAIARRTNFKSVNLYAETLLREINKRRGYEDHELSKAEAIMEHLEQALALDVSGVQLLDGSGLGTRNFFPPAFMTAYLSAKQNDKIFRSTIPVAGRSGSMKHRLKGTKAEGRLYSKSGSLNSARAYAGYAFPADGRKLAFCIMVNNYTVKSSRINRILLDFQLLLCQ